MQVLRLWAFGGTAEALDIQIPLVRLATDLALP